MNQQSAVSSQHLALSIWQLATTQEQIFIDRTNVVPVLVLLARNLDEVPSAKCQVPSADC